MLTRAEKESLNVLHTHTSVNEHTCCRGNGKWQTGKRMAASVSIYSSAGDDKEAGVTVNILYAARPIAWSLSLVHTHIIPAQMCSRAVAPFWHDL